MTQPELFDVVELLIDLPELNPHFLVGELGILVSLMTRDYRSRGFVSPSYEAWQ